MRKMLLVILDVSTVNKDIIEEDDDKLTDVSSADCVHEALKSGQRIGEANGITQKVEMSIVCLEYRLLFILRSHAMVADAQIKLGEECGAD